MSDAKDAGLTIRNPIGHGAIRKIRFFGLRVDETGGDGVEIGAGADKGQTADIGLYDLSVVQAGKAALR
jgi:hypothetical protein